MACCWNMKENGLKGNAEKSKVILFVKIGRKRNEILDGSKRVATRRKVTGTIGSLRT